jgi:hypothetical protein
VPLTRQGDLSALSASLREHKTFFSAPPGLRVNQSSLIPHQPIKTRRKWHGSKPPAACVARRTSLATNSAASPAWSRRSSMCGGSIASSSVQVPVFESDRGVRAIDGRDVGRGVEGNVHLSRTVATKLLTLRPEFTAGICAGVYYRGAGSSSRRSRLTTHGPVFRYERPQKGRYRQFHQIDAEDHRGSDRTAGRCRAADVLADQLSEGAGRLPRA